MIELERTYLAKYLPADLTKHQHKEIADIYIPATAEHPVTRIRKNGDHYEMTKKQPTHGDDASRQKEQTIILLEEEYRELCQIDGKRIRKIRYNYALKDHTAEFDVFQDALAGLVLVDIEFRTRDAQQQFTVPDFCLAEVTHATFLAGGMLCGKSFSDIESELKQFNYTKLSV